MVQLRVLGDCGLRKADEERLAERAYPTITRCLEARPPFDGLSRHTFSAEIVIDGRGLAKDVPGPFGLFGEISFEAWPCVRDYLARQKFEARSCHIEVTYRSERSE